MQDNWTERTELLIGEQGIRKLAGSNVLVTGLGGVGSWAAELLCRAGIGSLTIADSDTINASNRNRQLLALSSTEGKSKADLMKERLLDINPNANIESVNKYLNDEALEELVKAHRYDYVVDAIDTLTPKLYLIKHTLEEGLPLVSAMGSGGKSNPALVKVDDIDKSYNCKLAAIVRKRLHRMGIRTGFKVVFSPEKVNKETVIVITDQPNKKSNTGTISYIPPLFGIYCASTVISDILAK